MFTILKLLSSALILCVPAAVFADAKIYEVGKTFEENGKKRKADVCEGHIASVYKFPEANITRDPSLLATPVTPTTPANNEARERQQTRDRYMRTILKVLKDAKEKHEPMSNRFLQVHIHAILNFRDRMVECVEERNRFTVQDVAEYGELLNLAVENIFYKNPEGMNPLMMLTPLFTQQLPNFGRDEKYDLVTAVLASVDIGAAMKADENFITLIHWWSIAYHADHQRSPVDGWDKQVQSIINSLAGQIPALRNYMHTPE